jgi:hypothetical protein
MPDGVKLDNYLSNPVVALNHDYRGLAIGKTTQIEIKDSSIIAKVQFPDQGVYPLADTVYELYKGGFMSAWSIGFMPIKYEDLDTGGRQFNEWELLEYSAVLVPDNAEALTMLRSKGIDPEHIERFMITKDGDPVEETPEEAEEETPVTTDSASEVSGEAQATEPEATDTESTPEVAPEPADGVREETPAEEEEETPETPEETPEAPEEEEKSVKVLSGANRKKVKTAMEAMTAAVEAMQAMLDATIEEETPKSLGDQTIIDLVDALRAADKTIGIGLRNYKDKVKR